MYSGEWQGGGVTNRDGNAVKLEEIRGDGGWGGGEHEHALRCDL